VPPVEITGETADESVSARALQVPLGRLAAHQAGTAREQHAVAPARVPREQQLVRALLAGRDLVDLDPLALLLGQYLQDLTLEALPGGLELAAHTGAAGRALDLQRGRGALGRDVRRR